MLKIDRSKGRKSSRKGRLWRTKRSLVVSSSGLSRGVPAEVPRGLEFRGLSYAGEQPDWQTERENETPGFRN
jgi:hypothetical protein